MTHEPIRKILELSDPGALCVPYDGLKALLADLDRVTRERDEALKDARRYRMARRGQHWSVINDIGDTLRGEELDAAIDAALGDVGV